jgi:hypothetical protein
VGQPDEDFWVLGSPPFQAPTGFAPLFIPDPDDIPSAPIVGQPDEDFWAPWLQPLPSPQTIYPSIPFATDDLGLTTVIIDLASTAPVASSDIEVAIGVAVDLASITPVASSAISVTVFGSGNFARLASVAPVASSSIVVTLPTPGTFVVVRARFDPVLMVISDVVILDQQAAVGTFSVLATVTAPVVAIAKVMQPVSIQSTLIELT